MRPFRRRATLVALLLLSACDSAAGERDAAYVPDASAWAQGGDLASLGATEPWSFFDVPHDEVGFEGAPMAVQITPDGAFNTGFGELALGLGRDGAAPAPRVRELRHGYLPILAYSVPRDGLTYRVEAWAAPLDLDPAQELLCFVRVRATGTGEAHVTARFADWVADGSRVEREADEDWFVDRLLDEARWAEPTTLRRDGGRVFRNDHLVLRAPADGGVGDGFAWTATVSPDAPLQLDFVLPLVPVAPTRDDVVQRVLDASPDAASEAVEGYWRGRLAEAMSIALPEPKVVDTFRASLAWLLIARDVTATDRVVQTVSENTFKDFFPRDAAYMTRTYDMLGLHDAAFDTLERFIVYGADGPARLERLQPDDWGQSLWALGGHLEMTGDVDFAAWVHAVVTPHLDALEAATAADPLGLWPAAGPYDNEALDGHHYVGHSLWVLLGLAEAARLCATVADTACEDRALALRDGYLGRFLDALDPLTEETGGYIPPGLEVATAGFDWANVSGGVYPFGVFAPDDPRATATLARVRPGRYREGLMTYGPNAWAMARADAAGQPIAPGDLHHYLTMYVTQSLLASGAQEPVVADLYAVLAHTSNTHGGFERVIQPYGYADPQWNRPPHGWFAARYLELLRNMLVREDGEDLHLLSAVAPGWVAPGQEIAVERAATRFGDLDLHLVASEDIAVLTLTPRWRTPPRAVVVHVPWFVELVDARVDLGTVTRIEGAVVLSPEATRVTLGWLRPEAPPALSYAAAVQALLRKRLAPPTDPLEASLLLPPGPGAR
ncbi:MAG: hypothetical protein EP329_21125 [Deltaproteobacteria bacterium]|nr:MAG: hypothetical protein EP329_21125 [Deltaproteobacteria bacterium]